MKLKLGAYKPEESFKPGFDEKIRFFRFLSKNLLKSDNWLILRLSTATQSSTNLLFAWNQFSFLNEQMNSYHYLPVQIDEIGKNLDKSINETSVSSISTDWSIQSISIKSDLTIFIDLSIDKSVPIFIDWLLRDKSMFASPENTRSDFPAFQEFKTAGSKANARKQTIQCNVRRLLARRVLVFIVNKSLY